MIIAHGETRLYYQEYNYGESLSPILFIIFIFLLFL